MSRTMPFGRHRGERLGDLPFEYLEWLASVDFVREPLRSQIHAEYQRRLYSQDPRIIVDPSIVDELVGAGVRVLSKRYHPDMGGDHEHMVAVNRAADWLRQQARGTLA